MPQLAMFLLRKGSCFCLPHSLTKFGRSIETPFQAGNNRLIGFELSRNHGYSAKVFLGFG